MKIIKTAQLIAKACFIVKGKVHRIGSEGSYEFNQIYLVESGVTTTEEAIAAYRARVANFRLPCEVDESVPLQVEYRAEEILTYYE